MGAEKKTPLQEIVDVIAAVTSDTYITPTVKMRGGDVSIGVCTPYIKTLRTAYAQFEKRLQIASKKKNDAIDALNDVLKNHTPPMPPHFEGQDIDTFLNAYPVLKTKNELVYTLMGEELETMILAGIVETLLNLEIFKTFPELRLKEEVDISSTWEVFWHDSDWGPEYIVEIDLSNQRKKT
ncbi:MAG TPA: hypothetical protein VJH33_02380 [Candidatus Paceibacterota bacterium]